MPSQKIVRVEKTGLILAPQFGGQIAPLPGLQF
jgi:hypothetical protein